MGQGDIRKFFGDSRSSQPSSEGARLPNAVPQRTKRTIKDFRPPGGTLSNEVDGANDPDEASECIMVVDTTRGNDRPAQAASSPEQQERKVASASFSSNVTAASSQRRFRHGEVIILDSSESDSDLEDVDALLRRFRPAEQNIKPTKASTMPVIVKSGALSSIHSGRTVRGRTLPDKVSKQTRRDKAKAKYSLGKLFDSVTKERAREQDLDNALSGIGTSDDRTKVLESSTSHGASAKELDASMLASMIGGQQDEDGIERIVRAMKRTEAARGAKTWSFFKSERYSLDKRPPPPVPESLQKLFGSRAETEDAWETGFISDLASRGAMKADSYVLDWCLRCTIARQDKDIHFTYCSLLLIASSYGKWEFTVSWVKSMLNLVDAAPEAVDSTSSITPVTASLDSSSPGRNWPGITRVLEIIPRMAEAQVIAIPADTRRDTLSILCRLAVDSEIVLHHATYAALQDAMEILLDGLPEDDGSRETLVEDIGEHIKDPQLRLQLLSAFAGSSPGMCLFRHDLALDFFLEDVANQHAPNLPARLTNHLETHPQFKISNGMNFAWLASMIGILDVAVDDGNPGDDLSTDEEKQFNVSVDELANKVKGMSSLIRDTGANHISKTEAKEALEALHMRLLYSVRTKPRRKQNVFGKDTGTNGVGKTGSIAEYLQNVANAASDSKA